MYGLMVQLFFLYSLMRQRDIMASFLKNLITPGDARGPRGVFSRGKPIYKGGASTGPHTGKNLAKPHISLQEAARRKLMGK
jgi:hypothetical protein